jgi:hypothetical protein
MRKILSSIVLLSLLAVAGLSTAAAPVAGHVSAGASVSDARGARACFGIGTNNCCGEFMVVGVLAGLTGNIAAVALAAGASYVYCYV